jgi:Ca2+-binding EF-hand superfamily protein
MIKCGFNIPEEHLKYLFSSIDLDGHGLVSYTEFIAATIERLRRLEKKMTTH